MYPTGKAGFPRRVVPYRRRWFHDRYAGTIGVYRAVGADAAGTETEPEFGGTMEESARRVRWPEPGPRSTRAVSLPDARTLFLLPSAPDTATLDPDAMMFCGRWYPDRQQWITPHPVRSLKWLLEGGPEDDHDRATVSEPALDFEFLYGADTVPRFQVESLGDWRIPTHRGRMPVTLSRTLVERLRTFLDAMRRQSPTDLPAALSRHMSGTVRSVTIPRRSERSDESRPASPATQDTSGATLFHG